MEGTYQTEAEPKLGEEYIDSVFQPMAFRKVGITYTRAAKYRYENKYYGGTCCLGYADEYLEMTDYPNMLYKSTDTWNTTYFCCLLSLGMCGTGQCGNNYLYKGEIVSKEDGISLYQAETEYEQVMIQAREGFGCGPVTYQAPVKPAPVVATPYISRPIYTPTKTEYDDSEKRRLYEQQSEWMRR